MKNEFVRDLIEKASEILNTLPDNFLYHNINHTISVVQTVIKILNDLSLDGYYLKQHDLLLIAAWYHDTGYTVKYLDNEEIGCKIVADEMRKNWSDHDIYIVQSYIMATKVHYIDNIMLQFPGNDIGRQIICDADLNSFGSTNFFNNGIKQELANNGLIYSDIEILTKQKEMLENHQWFIKCKTTDKLEIQKQKNNQILVEKLKNEN